MRLSVRRDNMWKGEYVHGLMESHHIKRGTRNYPEVGEVVLIVREKKNKGVKEGSPS